MLDLYSPVMCTTALTSICQEIPQLGLVGKILLTLMIIYQDQIRVIDKALTAAEINEIVACGPLDVVRGW